MSCAGWDQRQFARAGGKMAAHPGWCRADQHHRKRRPENLCCCVEVEHVWAQHSVSRKQLAGHTNRADDRKSRDTTCSTHDATLHPRCHPAPDALSFAAIARFGPYAWIVEVCLAEKHECSDWRLIVCGWRNPLMVSMLGRIVVGDFRHHGRAHAIGRGCAASSIQRSRRSCDKAAVALALHQ